MRRLSSRLFQNSATLIPLRTGQDAAGGRAKAWDPARAVEYPVGSVSVQMQAGSRDGDYQGGLRSVSRGLAYFASDPGVGPDAQLVLHEPTGDRIYSCDGIAKPAAGQPNLWVLSILEVK